MANERGTAAQWVEMDPEAVAPAASRAYVVETETPGTFEVTETAPGASVEAVFEETSSGTYTLTDSPGAGARARLVMVAGTAKLVEVR